MRSKVLWALTIICHLPQSHAFNVRHQLTKCLVAIQRGFTPATQTIPVELSTNLAPYFGNKAPNSSLLAYNYDAPETLKDIETTQFRGLVVTQEQLENIAQNGLDPSESTQMRNSFGNIPSAIHFAKNEMNSKKYRPEKHIMIIVQVNPAWTQRLKQDPMQPLTDYTRLWIPPQGIQSIMAIDPASTERFRLVEISRNTPQ